MREARILRCECSSCSARWACTHREFADRLELGQRTSFQISRSLKPTLAIAVCHSRSLRTSRRAGQGSSTFAWSPYCHDRQSRLHEQSGRCGYEALYITISQACRKYFVKLYLPAGKSRRPFAGFFSFFFTGLATCFDVLSFFFAPLETASVGSSCASSRFLRVMLAEDARLAGYYFNKSGCECECECE